MDIAFWDNGCGDLPALLGSISDLDADDVMAVKFDAYREFGDIRTENSAAYRTKGDYRDIVSHK